MIVGKIIYPKESSSLLGPGHSIWPETEISYFRWCGVDDLGHEKKRERKDNDGFIFFEPLEPGY